MRRVDEGRGSRKRRAVLGLGLGALLLAGTIGAAKADEPLSYGDRAKAIIAQLLAKRDFKPESGCNHGEACAALLKQLRAGAFEVVEPTERSDRLDMPSYMSARRRCPAFDPAHIKASHRIFTATRNFAIYRLDIPRPRRGSDEVLVFRAQRYVVLEDARRAAAADDDEPMTLLPGTFVAIALPSCKFLSTAVAEDGDRFAKHNDIDDADHASELVWMGDRYFVLNLDPIAGPWQAKESWWYVLQLWDLGPHVDADRRKQRHIYSFGYKPAGAPVGFTRGTTQPNSG